MTPIELQELAEKYLTGTASPAEAEQLLAWYHSMDHRRIEIPLDSPGEKEAIRQRILSVLERQPGIKTRSIRIPVFWRVAAAILVLLGTGAYLLSTREKTAPISVSAPAVHQLAAGGNKAILTLDDGSQIVLDSAANGRLASQGATQVVKLSNGQLAYQPSDGRQGKTSRNDKVFYNRMETPKGGQYQLILPDGSKVWLNSASSIRYPNAFPGKDRVVRITGEAYFEIARSATQPFIVESDHMKVQVLGTEFNLMAYADEQQSKATLISGSVKVIKDNDSKVIAPGQMAAASNTGSSGAGTSLLVTKADIRRTIAWKNGIFDFQAADIQTIMRQLSRWYNIEVRYSGNVSDISLSGVISRKADASELLNILQETGKVKFDITGNIITVSPGRRS